MMIIFIISWYADYFVIWCIESQKIVKNAKHKLWESKEMSPNALINILCLDL